MNPEVKEKWVAALRSGKYEQTKYELRDVNKENCFCAMGVLWELYGQENNFDVWEYLKNGDKDTSDKVAEWAGLDPEIDVSLGPIVNDFDRIADLNDAGWLFSEIADIIEENVK